MDRAWRERERARIRRYRLIDDTFMSVVFRDKACTQLLIRTVLGRDDLVVVEVATQEELKNLWGRSVRLDIVARDEAGGLYNIEVQRADAGASPKRARYNSSLLDANAAQPGEEYEALAEAYVIFITENDCFGQGCPLYHVERVVQETGAWFGDGEHILYVNGQYRGQDPVGKLMHDFFCQNPEEMNSPVLAQNVHYYKEEEGGVDYMCRISEEIWREGRQKGKMEGKLEGKLEGKAELIRRFMKEQDFSFSQACDMFGLPQEERTAIEKLIWN